MLDARLRGHDSVNRYMIRGPCSRARNSGIEIDPIRVRFFDETDLPGSIPFLETFLALYREFDIVELLEVDQSVNAVAPGESGHRICAMLVDAAHEIICDADVERPANFAGENVDPIGSVCAHVASPVVTGSPAPRLREGKLR